MNRAKSPYFLYQVLVRVYNLSAPSSQGCRADVFCEIVSPPLVRGQGCTKRNVARLRRIPMRISETTTTNFASERDDGLGHELMRARWHVNQTMSVSSLSRRHPTLDQHKALFDRKTPPPPPSLPNKRNGRETAERKQLQNNLRYLAITGGYRTSSSFSPVLSQLSDASLKKQIQGVLRGRTRHRCVVLGRVKPIAQGCVEPAISREQITFKRAGAR